MVRVERARPRHTGRVTLSVAPGLEVEVVREGRLYRAIHEGREVSKVSGDFEEWCFQVGEHIICITRDELEVVLGGG